MMATVPHVTSGSGLRKFQADGFLSDRVYLLLEFYYTEFCTQQFDNCLKLSELYHKSHSVSFILSR